VKSIQTQRHAYVLQYLENVDLLYLCMPDIQVRSVEGSLGLNNYVTVPIAQYLNLGNCFVYYVMKSDIDCICHPVWLVLHRHSSIKWFHVPSQESEWPYIWVMGIDIQILELFVFRFIAILQKILQLNVYDIKKIDDCYYLFQDLRLISVQL
jgi:hypothetical protein